MQDARLAEEMRLLGRCIEGEEEAWRGLMTAYLPLVSAIARRLLRRRGLPHGPAEVEEHAADFFGDLCLKRREVLEKFRGEGPLRAYLAVLAANHVRRQADALLAERRKAGRYGDNLRAGGPREIRGGDALDAAEEVTAALGRCTEGERLLFQVLFVDGLAAGEAASFFGITREALYLRKHRFLKKLRVLLGERSVTSGGSPQEGAERH